MATIDSAGYVARRSNAARKIKRNWWLVKHGASRSGYIPISYILLPEHFIGKRVRFKIEVVEERK